MSVFFNLSTVENGILHISLIIYYNTPQSYNLFEIKIEKIEKVDCFQLRKSPLNSAMSAQMAKKESPRAFFFYTFPRNQLVLLH